MRALNRRNLWLPAVVGCVAAAWLVLIVWVHSPYAGYLGHGGWMGRALALNVCASLQGGGWSPPGMTIYVIGFLLMTFAMMAPSVLPLVAVFARMMEQRENRGTLITLLFLGYLAIWTAFGILAHLLNMALHAEASGSRFLIVNGWVVAAVTFGVAGVFQFSQLKNFCLEKCRTPFSFISGHWRGAAARRQSFMLGVHHGLFCVGCCWALMLLMFVVGMSNVGWMLALGALMAVEKTARWGSLLTAPLGAGLLLASTALIFLNI